METFTNSTAKLNPAKHVNYAYGMVLGVDDFTQEFAYLSARDQWMVRDMLGYGTVSGLKVTVTPANSVHVTPGSAVNQLGQMIHINQEQCAELGIWLADEKNRKELDSRLGSPPASDVKISVVLSYRECLADERPIPGEPCRDEKDLMAPSRVTDDYCLELCFDAPRQCEESGVRAFITALGDCVIISGNPGCITSLDFMETFATWVRGFHKKDLSPPCSPPDFAFGSPPESWLIHPDVAGAYLRAAFRIWVTELRQKFRPDFMGDSCDCGDVPPKVNDIAPEERLLLAELRLTLENGKIKGAVNVNEENRPFLVSMRMLQELLLCGPKGSGACITAPPFYYYESPPIEYQVVAAGIVRGDLTGRTPVLGRLRTIATEPGYITFTFDGYQKPDGSHQYIVKVMGVSNLALPVPTVRFLEYRDEGFVLRITGGVTKVKVEVIQKLEFILEVSRLGAAYE